MRHRMASYNEISYRFVKAKIEFYIPPKWRYQDKVNKQSSAGAFESEELVEIYKKALMQSYQTYEQLLEKGVARELARGVLPVSIYTEFIYTCNLHALMHFLSLRMAPGAQQEIRSYAFGLLKLAEPYFPEAFAAWRKQHPTLFADKTWAIDFINNLSNTENR